MSSQPKDNWDKIECVSRLLSAIIVSTIMLIGVLIVQKPLSNIQRTHYLVDTLQKLKTMSNQSRSKEYENEINTLKKEISAAFELDQLIQKDANNNDKYAKEITSSIQRFNPK